MAPAASLLLGALIAVPVDAPRLEYHSGSFTVHVDGEDWNVPIGEDAKPGPNAVAFRRNERYAVWDTRGLTLRNGDSRRTSRFADFPVSGRFFPKNEIQLTAELVADGRRSKAATALSGALRIGPDVYFLLRWDDKAGKPWTEALVCVHLGRNPMGPEIVGRFAGLSLAYKPIDDRMFLEGGRLSCIVRQGDHWGLADYDPKVDRFSFHAFGGTLLSYLSLGPGAGTFVERTPYGTTLAGRIDFRFAFRRTLLETRGIARFLDAKDPLVVLNSNGGNLRVVDADSGAELHLGQDYSVGRAGRYIVAWSPADKPVAAVLYDPRRWTALARWHIQ